jgi:UDP-N-acetyl-D-galactosamine dehydrogenase
VLGFGREDFLSTTSAEERVAVVGLGYVGLPLATALARTFSVVGFDIDKDRIAELRAGKDRSGLVDAAALGSPRLTFSPDPTVLRDATFIVVAVPTPVDPANQPDLTPLREASRTVGRNLSKDAVVVFESTVYPGCTEELCVPLIEGESGLMVHRDWGIGYSPERIDPGDSDHELETVVKIISAGDDRTLDRLDRVYGSVVKAGLYRAPDLQTAEAAKVVENVQRDLNIALMNELSILFARMGLDTGEVLAAAGTKWNFMKFYPGLVGGHCIPVDPYYLVYQAERLGYHPEVILAGRRVNDGMDAYVAQQSVKLLIAAGKPVNGSRALVLGLTFKENVRDFRNSHALGVVKELEGYGIRTYVHDPLVTVPQLADQTLADPFASEERYDLVMLAVPHAEYRGRSVDEFMRLLTPGDSPGVLVDIRGMLSGSAVADAGAAYWRL